jgi:hypothetical protein
MRAEHRGSGFVSETGYEAESVFCGQHIDRGESLTVNDVHTGDIEMLLKGVVLLDA